MTECKPTEQPGRRFLNTLHALVRFQLPLQWWVNDCCSGGKNWCKTTWKYVLTGKHRGQQVRLGFP